MSARLGVCVLALALAGCFQPMHEIVISPEFSPEETELIFEATEEWFEAIPELRIPVRVAENGRGGGSILPGPERICVGPVGGATRLRPTRSPFIWLCPPNRGLDAYKLTVLHELGHAFSLNTHHLPPTNIMARKGTFRPSELTPADIEHVLRALEER